MFIVNSDDKEGLHWFVCAMDCRVPVWAFEVWISGLDRGTIVWYLLDPANVEKPPTKQCFHTQSGFGFLQGWLVMWLSIVASL